MFVTSEVDMIYVIPAEALKRFLAQSLRHVGLSEAAATAVAETVPLEAPERWTRWVAKNCARCKENPATCNWFSGQDDVVDARTGKKRRGNLSEARLAMVERNLKHECPMMVPE